MKCKKTKKCVNEQAVETPVVEAVPVKEPRNWVVNCPKCGAALNLKEGGYAYMCPVCSTLLTVKTGARLVKDVSQGDKNLRVTFTENAVNYLAGKNAKGASANLETILAQNSADVAPLIVDADANGLTVKKA